MLTNHVSNKRYFSMRAAGVWKHCSGLVIGLTVSTYINRLNSVIKSILVIPYLTSSVTHTLRAMRILFDY